MSYFAIRIFKIPKFFYRIRHLLRFCCTSRDIMKWKVMNDSFILSFQREVTEAKSGKTENFVQKCLTKRNRRDIIHERK